MQPRERTQHSLKDDLFGQTISSSVDVSKICEMYVTERPDLETIEDDLVELDSHRDKIRKRKF